MEMLPYRRRLDAMLLAQHLSDQGSAKVARGRMALSPKRPERWRTSPSRAARFRLFRHFCEDTYSCIEQKYLQQLMVMAKNEVKEAIRISGLSQSRFYVAQKGRHSNQNEERNSE